MNILGRGLSAEPAELLSITERARYLLGLRLGLAGVVISADLFTGGVAAVPVSTVTVVYVALSLFSARSSDVEAALRSR